MHKKEKVKPPSTTSSQQRTLFQTWGAKITSVSAVSSNTAETDNNAQQFQPITTHNNNGMDEEAEEDEDRLLMEALEQTTNLSREIGTTSFELQDGTAEVDLSSIPDLPGFSKSAGLKWIYPTNYPLRAYQFDIVKSALFQNTLVALPTGLGKTFIAAVVMFNFYRWYPLGKIVFMAPTKPLVTQQIEACYNIMGIPQSDIAEMTGKMLPAARKKAWKEKRVIFLTPQVLINDLSRGTCEAAKMKCLVVDEAHKSLGNYAYCQVVQELVKITRDFRILALSATPGSKITTIQEVISNLLISHIELRTDDSLEIKKYSFERKVEKIVVPLGEELKTVETQYLELLESIVSRLIRQNVLYRKNVKSLSKFTILKCREEFRQNPPHHLQPAQTGVIEGDFALAISLYHGYELLQLHGLRPFYQYLQNIVSGDKGYGRTRCELLKNINFMNVYDYLIKKFGDKPSITFTQQTNEEKVAEYVIGHPKLEKLQEIVVDHFKKFQKEDGSSDTRIIIFSQYRNSVSDIAEMLKKQQPLVKVISFMGQSAGRETKGFSQKEQLKVMKEFREGSYNTLVSTCVGEEGLDIGDVDLIVCFDASKSPIRLVQRMGRTGRKRDGRIVMLVTEGKEDQIYKQGQYKKNSINKALLNQTKSLHYYQHSPRMIPDGLVPQCHKMDIAVKKVFETLDKEKARKKEEKKKTKVTKRKTKTVTDLMPKESSMDGRLTLGSHSTSSLQSAEFQPIDKNPDHFIDFDTRANSRTPSPVTYIMLSDDELPDLSPQKNKKALCNANVKRKPNTKTTRKQPPEKGHLKIDKLRQEERPIDPIIIISDDYGSSDFVEETKSACNISLLNNNSIKPIFKSQQEPPNSTKSSNSKESEESFMTKNNPANNCLVPVAPSVKNISNMLDNLKAQDFQKSFPNTYDLWQKLNEEFYKSIKRSDVLSSPKTQRISANLQTGVSGILTSSSVAQNKQKSFVHTSPEKMDCSIMLKDDTSSPKLGTISPQQNIQLLNKVSPDINHGEKKYSPKAVDSSRLNKRQNLKSSLQERNDDILSIKLNDDSPEVTKFLKSTSSMESVKDISKLSTSSIMLKDDTSSPKLGTISPQQNFQLLNKVLPDINHGQFSPKAVDSSRLNKRQNLKSSLQERNDDILSIKLNDDFLEVTKILKSTSSMESVKDISKLTTSSIMLKDDTSSPKLGTISPQQNFQLLNKVLSDINHGQKKFSPKAVDSSRLNRRQNLKSSLQERNDDILSIKLNDDSPEVTKILKSTSSMVSVKDDTSSPKLGTISPQQNIQLLNKVSPDIKHDQKKYSPKAVLNKRKNLKSSLQERNDKILSIPLHDDSPEVTKILKSTSSMESVKDTSKLTTSYGDLFAEFSQSFDEVVELVDQSCPLLEKSEDTSSEPTRKKLEISAVRNLANSDIFNEGILSEDDHPVFDLTTDIFSEDNPLDSTETPAADPNHIPMVSSERNLSDKSCSASKLSSLIVSFVNTKIPTSAGNGATNTEEDDLPQFDLELDFDVLPPTPEPVNPHSLSSKAFQSNPKFSTSFPLQNKVMSSSETHSIKEDQPSAARDEYSSLFSDEELHCVLPSLNVIGHLQHQSTPFSNKKATSEQPSSPHLNTKKDTFSLHQDEEEFLRSSFSSGGFDLKFDELSDDITEIPFLPKKQETQGLVGNPENVIEIDDNCDSSDDSFLVRKKKRVMLKSPSPVYQKKSDTFTNADETMDDDGEDSFCIRKKKKAAVLTSPSLSEGKFVKRLGTVPSASTTTGEDRVKKKTKKKESQSRCKRMRFMVEEEEEENSQEDFVKDKNVRKRHSVTKTKSGDKNRKLKQGQFDGRHFLDEEAELSGSDDEYSDEVIAEEEEEHYEQSFINDLSQIDRTQNVVDMRAVYLRSVVSPVAKHHGYKMNYRNHNVSDVYSCPPEPNEDYEYDSFCVESSQSSENFDESSFEKETPKAKKKKITKEGKKRRVIRQETSSEEDIFPDVVIDTPGNVSDKEKLVESIKNVKENVPSSKEGSSSVGVVMENKDCDDSQPLVLFADSREITGAQDIISDLRIQHKLNVVVTKLDACDYIVSLRTAVERKLMSDFANGANYKKLLKRLQEMCEYYERPCLIVENNPQKGLDKKNVPRTMPQTKYMETLLSQLSLSPIRLLFSNNKLETCSLLASLCIQENAKGMAVCRNQTLSDNEQQKMKFFLSLPKVNYALALNLCKNYKTIKEFLQSSSSLIVDRSKMSSERATYLHKFLRQLFN